jgi:hypothetical protein
MFMQNPEEVAKEGFAGPNQFGPYLDCSKAQMIRSNLSNNAEANTLINNQANVACREWQVRSDLLPSFLFSVSRS